MEIKDLLNAAKSSNTVAFTEAFKAVMSTKLAEALEAQKQVEAQKMFGDK